MTVCAHCNGTLENVRSNAKFCSRKCKENHKDRRDRGKAESVPAAASHIGAMWTWPEAEREKYAVREVGYRLNNWLRTQHHVVEIPASEAMANMSIAF